MAVHIRKNDIVVVMAGDHRGSRGKVLRVDHAKGKVVVEGVNMVHRHVRPTRRNPQGGRVQKEAPVHISNVLPYDSTAGKASRVRFEVDRDATGRLTAKRRVAKTGVTLHELSNRSKKKG
jgi:large subunit ribosomal protein L24